MRTTLNLSNDLYQEASQATGVAEKTKLIHLGLEALIRETASRRLARLYGSVKKAKAPSRRKTPQ
ncbi:MAG: hypothetical protein A3G32_07405 [Deltaproteobacteria bacterium RIFCSPLOWO2_12_FULL_40_28]|nr:MAG: hypothetical protein A3C45_07450 [Deltaproteobacteria bacterium RIFCSPHIGHO2_02_FULL_40_28]OGQ19218.1 MAG: hypothetical protein A3E27_04365 [Deltaproteobacteria bacterium RIFCSPHIGHO2_12_FULL_40_32]OGQ40558.1 MAG: hypothetical protein A3I69_00705 [Deltaproteobacteria bacterium RIFCSPLOWO2_02_FULL_40_36]OGQ53793.1 MAG: hypothetical protein A3G32_07405 [Deltaproteobacteria bacterium RIFCSPLOWO2_12_FULL_40_28]